MKFMATHHGQILKLLYMMLIIDTAFAPTMVLTAGVTGAAINSFEVHDIHMSLYFKLYFTV